MLNRQHNNYNEQHSNVNDAVKNLNLGCWNIEGLSKHESSVDLINFVKCFDIFGFCETCGQNANQFDNCVTGFQAYSSIRKNVLEGVAHLVVSLYL